MGNSSEGSATNAHFDVPMQEITDRLESKLFGKPEGQTELDETEGDEVIDDDHDDDLPEDDDSDPEDQDGLEKDDLSDDQEYSISEILGVDDDRITVNDDGEFLFTAIIDGEKKNVSLKELASSYQLQGHVNNKSIALENQRKEFEQQKSLIESEIQHRIEKAEYLSKVLEDELVSEFNSIDWDRLRLENPAEWTALRQEYSDRANKISESRDIMAAEKRRIAEEHQAKQNAYMQQHLKEQFDKVIQANPSWADESIMKAEQEKMRSFLTSSYGFTDDDLKSVSDHRLIGLIQDAQKYREGVKRVEEKAQKKVPKFRKPGAAIANANQLAKARKIKANKKAIRDSGGGINAIAQSILDRM